MKLVLLLSLLGVTVVSGIILDRHGGRRRPYNSFDSSSSESHEHRPRTRRPRPPPPPPPTPCPYDWITFDRPQGRWCVKLFLGNIDYNPAQTQCLQMGATVTGLQNETERLIMAAEGRRLAQLNRFGDTYIWLGAIRKAECPRVNICQPADTFQWIDGFTTGTDSMKFGINEPNGVLRGNLAQDCLQQFIFPNSETSGSWPTFRHGDYDDQFCMNQAGPRYGMYACGRRP